MAHPQPRIGAMYPLDGMDRPGGDLRWSPRATQPLGKEHNMEDDHTPHRKSVLAKVKEKARKWRQTLSKKKHNEDANATPSWGVSLEDEDDEDEDPEYLGAPMYESEMAPVGYKETARQHPRVIHVTPEKHVLTSSVNNSNNSDLKSPSPAKVPNTTTETVAEKLAPAYATVTDTTHAIASKIQSLTLSKSEAPAPAPEPNPSSEASLAPNLTVRTLSPPPASPKAKALIPQAPLAPNLTVRTSSPPPASAPAPAAIATKLANQVPTEMEKAAPTSAPAAVAAHNHPFTSKQIWDKRELVKEYIMQKLEPGEDERALSQVISEAISPRKTPGDASVVEKVKEAVTSLLRKDGSPQRAVYHSAQNSSSHIPISNNAHEGNSRIVEEENHGRILQAN
ncbi:COPII coat assembly protein sec16 isoform X1 [Hevea brasiliensis]|uniref:COPII coat assembly protein sec16 isoform X1 n=1 Tax=Hevea brasiliensis TaxID=3981 RepID=UPI0025D92FA5|nr:COPII coat assembly protein sec16 isoform X1 [Hevea brasiliensis]